MVADRAPQILTGSGGLGYVWRASQARPAPNQTSPTSDAMPYYTNDPESYPHTAPSIHVQTFHMGVEEFTKADPDSWMALRVSETETEAADLAGWYWWACLPGCMPDGEAEGPFKHERAALEASRGMDPHEREQIELVFGLGGGELSDEPWTYEYTPKLYGYKGEDDSPRKGVYHYWYECAPEYSGDHALIPVGATQGSYDEDDEGNLWEWCTAITNVTFGPARVPIGWEFVAQFVSSGEAQCLCVGCEDLTDEDRAECPVCEGSGIVYLGEGMAEVVFRRLDEAAAPPESD